MGMKSDPRFQRVIYKKLDDNDFALVHYYGDKSITEGAEFDVSNLMGKAGIPKFVIPTTVSLNTYHTVEYLMGKFET